MNEPAVSQKTEDLMKDTFKAISPILMKPINNSLTHFINNTLRLINDPQKKENVKRQVSIKAHKYASYVGKSIKSIIGDMPPIDIMMTIKSFSQLGVFMISEINNILLTASLLGVFPKININTSMLTPIIEPVLNLDITIMESLNKARDSMIEKSVVTIRDILERGLKGDKYKIDVLMEIIFVPFITIFLTELFKIVFADFKNPSGAMEMSKQPQSQLPLQRTLGGLGGGRRPHKTRRTSKTRKQKNRLITKYRKYTNNKTKTRSRASRSRQRH
jgi:hypothetical protein